jgi:hypothetical protein
MSKKKKEEDKKEKDPYMDQLIEVPVTHPLNDTGKPLKILQG